MFEIKTNNPTVWKNIISLINSINEECVMNITKSGVEFKAMPFDHASLIHFIWGEKNMGEFKCDTEQKIGFRLDEFNKILGRAKNEPIDVKLTKDNLLNISIGDSKSYNLRLVSTEHIDNPPTPKPLETIDINMSFVEFKEKMQDLIILGASFKINIENGKITFKSSIDAGSGESYYKDDSIKVKEPIEGEFSLYHMEKTLKSVTGIDDVLLSFGNGKPMRVLFKQPEVGDIGYYLAPIQKR